MYPPPTRARASLHLLVVEREHDCPDPAGLLAVLGERTDVATVTLWTAPGAEPDAETVRGAADLLDRVEAVTGRRPRYGEIEGVLDRVVTQLVAGDSRTGGSIVAVSARAPRRVVRALRRSAASAGAHLALLPPPRHRMSRRVPS